MPKMIDEKISIEELVDILPAAVTYLSKKGIKCIACGEPIWGTLLSSSSGHPGRFFSGFCLGFCSPAPIPH